MQVSSEGETRGFGRTRPAGKAKEKGMEDKVNTKPKEGDLATMEKQQETREKGRNTFEWPNMGPVAHT